MKAIQKEKIVKSYYTVYAATDGTEFTTKDECIKYERSQKSQLFAEYNKLIVGEMSENYFLEVGSDDIILEVIKVKSAEDSALLLQMFFEIDADFRKCYEKGDKYYVDKVEWLKRVINDAIENDDYLIVERGYFESERDSCFWIRGSLSSILNGIKENLKRCIKKD